MEFLTLLPEILEKAAVVIGAASTVATITPTKKDDSITSLLGTLIHMLAMNFGKARNQNS